jgi:hypothetical protein
VIRLTATRKGSTSVNVDQRRSRRSRPFPAGSPQVGALRHAFSR